VIILDLAEIVHITPEKILSGLSKTKNKQRGKVR
jgi:hypothetical protein